MKYEAAAQLLPWPARGCFVVLYCGQLPVDSPVFPDFVLVITPGQLQLEFRAHEGDGAALRFSRTMRVLGRGITTTVRRCFRVLSFAMERGKIARRC